MNKKTRYAINNELEELKALLAKMEEHDTYMAEKYFIGHLSMVREWHRSVKTHLQNLKDFIDSSH